MRLIAQLFLLLLLIVQSPAGAENRPLVFQPVNGGAYFSTQELFLDSIDFNTLIIRIKAERESPATVYFATSYDPQFNPPKSVSFSLKKGEHEYVVNLAARNRNWAGWIKGLAMTPGPEGNIFAITSADVTKANILINFRTGWQEFWGQEAIVGRTVNIIMGQTILGKAINFYVYIFIGLAFVILLIFSPANSQRQILIISLGLFALLEGRMWFDYGRQTIADTQALWGRSLAEKRELVTGDGLYNFVLFCQRSLPAGAEVEFATPGDYYSGKGTYYIYPHRVKKEAPFLLVFHSQVDQNKYTKFAQFREGEFILKKR